jgi:hypothetical protein
MGSSLHSAPLRLPIGKSEAMTICADAYPQSGDLIPEQLADDYVDQFAAARYSDLDHSATWWTTSWPKSFARSAGCAHC